MFGVPMCLDHSCFNIYTTYLSPVLSKTNDVKHHICTTYTQHIQFKKLFCSLILVQDWMYTNKLKLNLDKKFLLIGNKCHRDKFKSCHRYPWQKHLSLHQSPSIKVLFDSDFNFVPHINPAIKICNYHIHQF